MQDLISEYLFMLYSLDCVPYEIPKYLRMYPTDINNEKLTPSCLRLRCFIHNNISDPKIRSRVEAAVNIYNMQNIGDLATHFWNRDTEVIDALGDISIPSSMCDNCSKYDWSEISGKRNP